MIIWIPSHSYLDVLLSFAFCIAVESLLTDVFVGNVWSSYVLDFMLFGGAHRRLGLSLLYLSITKIESGLLRTPLLIMQ